METTEELQRKVDRYIKELFDDTGLRAEWKDYIYENVLKMDNPTSLNDICRQIRFKYVDFCDDTIPCMHNGKIYSEKGEWVHQIRNCLESLKDSGKSKNVRRGNWIKL